MAALDKATAAAVTKTRVHKSAQAKKARKLAAMPLEQFRTERGEKKHHQETREGG